MAGMRRVLMAAARGLAVAAVVPLSACGGSRPPADAPVESALGGAAESAPVADSVDTGKDCATAEVQCGGGTCVAHVKNACTQSVRCELAVTATCDAPGGSAIDSDGRAADNVAPGSTSDVAAQATCTSGRALHTEARGLSCK
jgi:hypothetical protein